MSFQKEKILIIGASGQIGIELTETLSKIYGNDCVIISDLNPPINSTNNTFEKKVKKVTLLDYGLNIKKTYFKMTPRFFYQKK